MINKIKCPVCKKFSLPLKEKSKCRKCGKSQIIAVYPSGGKTKVMIGS